MEKLNLLKINVGSALWRVGYKIETLPETIQYAYLRACKNAYSRAYERLVMYEKKKKEDQ